MSWYKKWFNSPLYEQIYADRDEREAQRLVSWLQQVIPPDEYKKILDLGCGRGRHAVNLAEAGYEVKGIDLSESAIEKARERKQQRNLDNLTFQVGDMREQLPEKFDAIVNLFTSFGYFDKDEENAKIIENISNMLKEGGAIVLDYFNTERVRRQYTPYETGRVKNTNYSIERYVEDGAIYKEIEFNGANVNGNSKYQERVKLYDLNWFENTLKRFHLSVEKVFGDYDGRRYDSEVSPRMIILATKS